MEGIGVTQAWFVSRFHGIFDQYKLSVIDQFQDGLTSQRFLPIKKFAEILSNQLIWKGQLLFRYPSLTNRALPLSNSTNDAPLPVCDITVESMVDLSTFNTNERGERFQDKKGQVHPMLYLPKKQTR